jgi:AraC-like DNA-binding protein
LSESLYRQTWSIDSAQHLDQQQPPVSAFGTLLTFPIDVSNGKLCGELTFRVRFGADAIAGSAASGQIAQWNPIVRRRQDVAIGHLVRLYLPLEAARFVIAPNVQTPLDLALPMNYPGFVFRALRDEGIAAEALLEDTGLTDAMLGDPTIPIKTVAFELGFDTPSNFARSFKIWSDASPSEYCARLRAAVLGGQN